MATGIRLQLSDQEWLQLLDGRSEDSQLSVCCANISALRDVLTGIVRSGRDRPMSGFELADLKRAIKWVQDGHDLSPLLQKVCQQIDFDPTIAEHEAACIE